MLQFELTVILASNVTGNVTRHSQAWCAPKAYSAPTCPQLGHYYLFMKIIRAIVVLILINMW